MTEALAKYRVRSCCSGGPGSHVHYLEHVEPPAGTKGFDWEGPIHEECVERELPPRRANIACHEAAHAVMGVVLGGRAKGVQVDGQPLATTDLVGLSWVARVLTVMAGDLAMDRRAEWGRPLSDEDIGEHAQAINAMSFGHCDNCQAFFWIVQHIGLDAPIENYRACYRVLERKTNEILMRPDVWAAISELTEVLMGRGVVNGEKVHEIVERHVPRGSITIEETDDAQ